MIRHQVLCCCVYIYNMDATTNEMLALVFSRFKIPFVKLTNLDQLPTHCQQTKQHPFLLTSAHLQDYDAQQLVSCVQQQPNLHLVLIEDALQEIALPLQTLQAQDRVFRLLMPVSIKRLIRYLASDAQQASV